MSNVASAGPNSFPMLVVQPENGGKRDKLGGYGPRPPKGPGPKRQADRLNSRFQTLQAALDDNKLLMATDMAGLEPELVVVFELNSSLTSFATAVKHVDGLSFIAEIEADPIDSDDDFQAENGKQIDQRLYVVANNAKALKSLLQMWTAWKAGDHSIFKVRGFAGWKQVFDLLRDVREWSPEDRLRDSQLSEAWEPQLDRGQRTFLAEVELWFRGTASERSRQRSELVGRLNAAGARVVDEVDVDSIAYHAVLVEVDSDQARSIMDRRDILVYDRNVASIRPQMVGGVETPASELQLETDAGSQDLPTGVPLVALLDGVPMQAHTRLTQRIHVDDPLDVASTVPSAWRTHGSAMSSLVVWGDLYGESEPLRRPLFVRPIFEATNLAQYGVREHMPQSRLVVGYIRDALEAMYYGTANVPPSAPSVKVVVLAAGHTALPFGRKISPWARLLDYYSSKLGILFIVSAGNHLSSIELSRSEGLKPLSDPAALQDLVVKRLLDSTHERRLLSPSEAMNVLTVGALHADQSGHVPSGSKRDLIDTGALPSPVSAAGSGYLRSIKPDVYANGGRILYRERLDIVDRIVLEPTSAIRDSPGLLVASPGLQGELSAVQHLHGTSAAAGVIGHQAALLAESLLDGPEGAVVEPWAVGVATRALLVNTASWQNAESLIGEAQGLGKRDEIRRRSGRYLGYGSVRTSRIAVGARERITILVTGRHFAESAREVRIPLPLSLSGRPEWRRAAVTLSSFTPTNPRDKSYRRSRLWFSVTNADTHGLSRQEADWHAAQRGTLQHELFDGSRASLINDGDALLIRINCAEQAGGLESVVPYALAVTFEMAPTTSVQVYSEIESRLRATTRVRSAEVRV
ncbi:S8 family peptidase [Clavibacter michiganensis]|uniref:S8 family peptidase n=2 Tax=Clavibacter michiganensis TaxID=28447 RepID=UPI00374E0CA8